MRSTPVLPAISISLFVCASNTYKSHTLALAQFCELKHTRMASPLRARRKAAELEPDNQMYIDNLKAAEKKRDKVVLRTLSIPSL